MMSLKSVEKYYADVRKQSAKYVKNNRKTIVMTDRIEEDVTAVDYFNYNVKTGNVSVSSCLLSHGVCVYPTKLKRVTINDETVCKLTNQRNELARRWTKNHKGYYNRYS